MSQHFRSWFRCDVCGLEVDSANTIDRRTRLPNVNELIGRPQGWSSVPSIGDDVCEECRAELRNAEAAARAEVISRRKGTRTGVVVTSAATTDPIAADASGGVR